MAVKNDDNLDVTLLNNRTESFGKGVWFSSKVLKNAFYLTMGSPREHVAGNGSEAMIHREF